MAKLFKATLFNETRSTLGLDGPELSFLPKESWAAYLLTLGFTAGFLLLPGFITYAWCYSKQQEHLTLPLALSIHMLCGPLSRSLLVLGESSNEFFVLAAILGCVRLAGLLLAVALVAQLMMRLFAMEEDGPIVKTKRYADLEGAKYPYEYVGCMRCNKVLGKDYFFSCKTCTDKKIGCTVSYELCRRCVLQHDRSHEVMQWEDGRYFGAVDFEASARANNPGGQQAQALLRGAFRH